MRKNAKLREWAHSIKPGDYIGTCDGCNRKVASIEEDWKNEGWFNRSKRNKTRVLLEIIFTDVNGRSHYCPGGGCAFPAQTAEEVTEYFRHLVTGCRSIEDEKEWGWFENHEKLRQAFKEGRPIVDAFGELLPEFDPSKAAV